MRFPTKQGFVLHRGEASMKWYEIVLWAAATLYLLALAAS